MWQVKAYGQRRTIKGVKCKALLAKIMPMIGKSGNTKQRKMMDDSIAQKSAMPLARASLRSAGPILCTMG